MTINGPIPTDCIIIMNPSQLTSEVVSIDACARWLSFGPVLITPELSLNRKQLIN